MLRFNYPNSIQGSLIRLFTFVVRRTDLKRLKENYLLFIAILQNCVERHNKQEENFSEAFLLLGNKLLIDVQSAKILCSLGLYGSAHGLVSVVIRTIRMMGALLIKPELLPEYLAEEKTSDKNQEFMRKFSEGGLQKILDDRFGKNERGEYANMDKALHGSSVGSKVYYARIRHNNDGTKGGDITFNAFFEDEKSGSVINILSSSLLDACGVYLEKYQDDKNLLHLRNEYDIRIRLEIKDIYRYSIINELKNLFRRGSKRQLK